MPGTHAPIPIEFADVAGSSCGALLPTGNVTDVVEGTTVTCIDNGMPVVCLAASDLGLSGQETPAELEGDAERDPAGRGDPARLRAADEPRRRDQRDRAEDEPAVAAGARRRHLDPDVHPPPRPRGDRGAGRGVRRHRLPAARIRGQQIAVIKEETGGATDVEVEHPTGFFTVTLEVEASGGAFTVTRSALLRTARLLMRGEVLVPSSVWSPA